MTKHVSSGGDATSSPRDAATESLPIRESADAADAAAQHLPQGAAGAPGSDGNTAGNTDGRTDVKDLKAAAGSAGSEAVRTEALAKGVTPDSAKGSGAAHSAAGAALPTPGWAGRGSPRMLRTPRPSASCPPRPRRPRRPGPRRVGPGTAVAPSWALPGWRCWRAPSAPGGGPTSSSAPTPSTVRPSSRGPATVRACPEGAREVPVGEAPVVMAGPVGRCPEGAPADRVAREAPVTRTGRTAREVREEALVEPAGPPPTGTPPVARARVVASSRAPARVMATRRAAQAPRASSSSRAPLRARRAEAAGTAAAHRSTFSSQATRIRVACEVLVGVCRFGYGRWHTSYRAP